MESSKIMMFPEMGSNSIDPSLLMALNNNGGFGGNTWIWILFLWMIWGWGGNGAWGNNRGSEFLSNQISNDTGRELLMNAIQGNSNSIDSLANLLNTEVQTVQNGIFTLNNAINSVGNQVGMSGLQVQNAIQSGNAAIASQICQCCCENRLAIANQTNSLQQTMATNHAAATLQSAQQQAADQLAVCQQTNTLTTQAERNTRDITEAINAQSVMINDKFCDLEKRELQNKINTQGDIITQLKNEIVANNQTLYFNNAFRALDDKIDAIAAKQPNTVPVQWPNLTAVNTTPYVSGGIYGYGNGFWGNNVSF